MMTRNIRKVISIVCAVALVLSLCVASFVGTTSAFKLSDTPTGTSLKLDFESGKGVASHNSRDDAGVIIDPADPSNKVMKIITGTGGGSPNWIPGASTTTELDNTAASGAFTFKAATTYVVTFKVKFGKGSNGNTQVALYYTDTSGSSGKKHIGERKFTIDATNGETIWNDAGTDSVLALKEDTDWMTWSFTITTPNTFANGYKHLALVCIQSDKIKPNILYFDDFMIDEVNELENMNTTKVYNGRKDSDGSFWAPNKNGVFANSNQPGGSYVDNDGYHFHPLNSINAGYNMTTALTIKEWAKSMLVHDPDHDDVKLEKDAKYFVTVKYKQTAMNDTGNTKLAIAHGTGNGGTTLLPIAIATNSAVQTEWQYLTAYINGNDYLNEHLYLYMASNSSQTKAEILIESVTVQAIRNSAGVVKVDYDTSGGDKINSVITVKGTAVSTPIPTHADTNKTFAGWYLDSAFTNAVTAGYAPTADVTLYAKWSSQRVTVKFVNDGKETSSPLAPGTVLSRPERPTSKAFFVGWATDKALTNIVTTVPENDCTLYAKYTIAYSSFNQGGWSDSYAFTPQIVADPDDASNKVLKITSSTRGTGNIELAASDIVGASAYRLELNTKYFISFKYKVGATADGGKLILYTGQQSAYSGTANKYETGIGSSWNDGNMANGSDWITVSGYYTTGSTFYKERVNWSPQYQLYLALIGMKNGKENAAAVDVYIDEVMIVPETGEIPAGATTISFHSNSGSIAPIYGYPGETIMLPENPTMASHIFEGWYTDKYFNNKFTATVYGDEDVELYAKWSLTDWVMDFEHLYNTGGLSGRFKLVTEGGNTYLHYRYEDAAANSTAESTAFGRATFNRGDNEPYDVIPGCKYTISFKYKVIEFTGDTPKFKGLTSNKFSTWGNSVECGEAFDLGIESDTWINCELTVGIAKDIVPSANFFGFGVNGDATVLFDDFKITQEVDMANVYGSVVISFNTNGGSKVDAVGGEPGEKVILPKNPTRAGYIFKGWYSDTNFNRPYTSTVYGSKNLTLNAAWALARLTESFEDLPSLFMAQGFSGAYTYYDSSVTGYDRANVQAGSSSVFRQADVSGNRGFAVCRDASRTLDVGSQYTVSFYVKPTNVGDAAGTISLLSLSSNTAVSAPDNTEVITTVGELKVGEWQQVSYTFTASENFIGIASTGGNDIYFDNVTINLVGYVGSSTGDSSVSPVIITMMIVLAAGALLITGKKVFAK